MSLKLATDANGDPVNYRSLFEDVCLSKVLKVLVMWFIIFQLVGAAFADVAMRKFSVCEFVDNDQFSNVEVSPLCY